ncbi:putative nuclease HARBI1 [Rhodamnia argentea]|uniref:Nuclease HARBI1 n=1 Tax=Rhodamnia argentea TaxID=178133 RepID=A0A8B8PR62_9MYRT|nr:putative nuclease HARBI1 [Rhodamnia argentea]
MRVRGWLKDSHYIKVDEQAAIFLSLIGHGNSNRDLCERFQHSGQTISTYFTNVLKVFLKLSKEIIKPPSFDDIPEEILMDRNHRRYFKGCIGAIDGTHINACVPVSKQIPYRGGKGTTTRNVLCVCSFDMKFTFVYAGWEGSANDCRVLLAALETPRLQFPHPPTDKYYVLDSGYAALPGFLTPFKGEQYHPNDYRGRGRRPRIARELFNHRHSSLRNVIERSFGALKNRFSILRHMPPFTVRKQARIVIICCALHN